tara:strand:+ start:432 stop:830 length:399 start_codon:yes stop_codon:yes gene_type:complete
MKKPLKEMLKKIGGKHLLIENRDVSAYSDALGNYIRALRFDIRGWQMDVEYHSGSWEWTNRKFDNAFYATWGWEGKNEIPIESDEGDDCGTIKQKFKGTDPENEKQLKIDAQKYIALMKKEIPKIEKKLLEY